jgi:hypothetical protein
VPFTQIAKKRSKPILLLLIAHNFCQFWIIFGPIRLTAKPPSYTFHFYEKVRLVGMDRQEEQDFRGYHARRIERKQPLRLLMLLMRFVRFRRGGKSLRPDCRVQPAPGVAARGSKTLRAHLAWGFRNAQPSSLCSPSQRVRASCPARDVRASDQAARLGCGRAGAAAAPFRTCDGSFFI